ncbi:hypothetical protein BCF46_1913 [Litoreibacter meonggei]|uniref:Uncharacterized protein n=1 Tax=Litoreibacter meonggei TaxID=1049199 RepID=A0A497WF08_9RHOB|nr:hypothetical protein [Litoreibacter meonggei]RLJ51698.1 hypothetical protein BCF46_1913 [Litoreibacter meonggei]
MVVFVYPIAWGIAILAAAGASALALQRYREEELELGRIELPDYLQGNQDPDPDPERTPPRLSRPTNTALRQALEQMVRTQRRIRDRCDDEEQEDCPYCKPAVDGRATSPWHIFQAGPVRKPSPRARGALYQHYVIPWFGFNAVESGDQLTVHIEEWEWKRGRAGSWDGLHHAMCKLIECKLGYRDWLDETLIVPRAFGDPAPAQRPHLSGNPRKPWLSSLMDEWQGQITEQHAAFDPDWPVVTLEWTFSDSNVLTAFLMILGDMGIYNIQTKHVPYSLAPTGTTFIRELYASGEEDYGYWEDN